MKTGSLIAMLSLGTALPSLADTYYRSFTREPETSAAFAQMGIPNRCFFAANTINSLGGPYCQYDPIWTGIGRYDGASLDVARVKAWAGVPFKTPGVSVTDCGGWQAVYAYDDVLYTPEKLRELFLAAGCTPFAFDTPDTRIFELHAAK